jgi:hypothetical protein
VFSGLTDDRMVSRTNGGLYGARRSATRLWRCSPFGYTAGLRRARCC